MPPKYLDDPGGWIPIDKAAVASLPRDRAYGEVEAMVSLSVDRDGGHEKSVREYARIWRWSRGRVERFFERIDEDVLEEKHAKSLPHVISSERATNGPPVRPPKLKYVKNLRRPTGHQQGHERATTRDPDPDPKKKSVRSNRERKPWHGLGKDLERLLACEAYLLHLAEQSPVLGQWTFEEIRSWARTVVAKGNRKRAARGDKPLSNFPQYLAHCVAYATPSERPRATQRSVQPELLEASASMGIR